MFITIPLASSDSITNSTTNNTTTNNTTVQSTTIQSTTITNQQYLPKNCIGLGNETFYSNMNVNPSNTFNYPLLENGTTKALAPAPCQRGNVLTNTVVYPAVSSISGTSDYQISAVPLTYGLVGYWPMDEKTSGTCSGSVYDLTGNNVTLPCYNSPTYVSNLSGGALNFSGYHTLNQNIHTTSFPRITQGAYSIWIKINAASGVTTYPRIMSTENANGSKPSGFGIYQPANTHTVEVEITTSSNVQQQGDIISFPLGQWVLTFVYYNGTKACQVAFLSSVPTVNCGISATGNIIYAPSSGLGIGGGYNSNYGSSQGNYTLDDARIWNIVPTLSQMSELYSSTIPNLENTVTTANNVYQTNYFEQIHQTLSVGNIYTSLGVNYTASVVGSYWVDSNALILFNTNSFSSNTNTCSDTSNATPKQMGFGLYFTPTLTSSATITLNWETVLPSATITSTYVSTYGTGTAPTCNSGATGTVIGNTYEFVVLGTGATLPSSLTFTLTGLTKGVTYWIDLQVTDYSLATWIYYNPQLSVVY
jgi:hypothetical protein